MSLVRVSNSKIFSFIAVVVCCCVLMVSLPLASHTTESEEPHSHFSALEIVLPLLILNEDGDRALDDALLAQVGMVNTSLNVLANDNVLATARISTYGGPDESNVNDVMVGGSYTSAAGAVITIASDGSLTYDATGIAAATSGTDIFFYAVENVGRTEVAQVTVRYGVQPTAQDDSDLTTDFDTTLMLTNDSGLLANDVLGAPAAQLLSFGGGTLGGTIADNQAGATITAAGGSLTVNADGSLSFTEAPFDVGSISFSYRLSNEFGMSEGAVTLTVVNQPIANDDLFLFGNLANQTTPANLFSDNGSGADRIVGGSISSFGGGSLGGSVTTNNADSSAPLAGGTLTVNSSGTWSLTGQPFTPGIYTFMYRLQNANGSSDATVTLDITAAPVANDDGVILNSVPGDDFHALFNTPYTVVDGATADLDQNDSLANPTASIESFGAVQLNNGAGVLGAANGAVSDNAANTTLNFSSLGVAGVNDGSLTVNANGGYTLVPPANYTGLLRFQYRLRNAAGSDTATVTLAVGVRPQCTDDTYNGTVNIPINVANGVNDVLSNDSGDSINITGVQGDSAGVGRSVSGATSGLNGASNQVILEANGAFQHAPAAGVVGANTFSYTAANGFAAETCNVTVTTGRVSGASPWFIDASAADSGNFGTFSDPFTSVAAFNTVNIGGSNQPGLNDVIYLDPNGVYNEADGINLLNGQDLFGGTVQFAGVYAASSGNRSTLSPSYISFASVAEGTPSQISATQGNGIDLALDNRIDGINIGNTPSNFGLNGLNVGNLVVNSVSISGTGGAVRVSNGGASSSVTLSDVTSTSSLGSGLDVQDFSGSFTITGSTTISNASVDGINIEDSNAAFTFNGLTNIDDAGGRGVDLRGSNGAVTFANVDIDDSTLSDFSVTNNTNSVSITAGNIASSASANGGVTINAGSANVTVGANITNVNGLAVQVANKTSGTATFNGAITSSGAGSTGISVQDNSVSLIDFNGQIDLDGQGVSLTNNTVGSQVRFDGGLDINSGVNTAVNILGNTGGTVDFSNTLNIDTTTGTGFIASGATTVNVAATTGDQSIRSTSGQGLILSGVSSTTGIHFDSVDTGDTASAANGIAITNTTGAITVDSVDIDGATNNAIAITNSLNTVSINGGGASAGAGGTVLDVNGGAANITVAAALLSSTLNDLVIDIQNRTGGLINISGNIAGGGLNVANNSSGGTTRLSGTSKLFTTGANTAVNLTNNLGHLIDFTNGGLIINTTSGTGFNANGAGNVRVQGAGNTVDTTTGTAVNINGVTITPIAGTPPTLSTTTGAFSGNFGVTFQRVNVNGATQGIVLNNAGSGGFRVTGTGTTAGSGGTIQNTTADGIDIINTDNISLANLNLTNNATASTSTSQSVFGGNIAAFNAALDLSNVDNIVLNNLNINGGSVGEVGISGQNVVNVFANDVAVQNFGDTTFEDNVQFQGLTGVVGLNNFTSRNSGAGLFSIFNTAGDLTLSVENSIFQTTNSTTGRGGLEISAIGTGTSSVTVNNSLFGNGTASGSVGGLQGTGLSYNVGGTHVGSLSMGANNFNGVNVGVNATLDFTGTGANNPTLNATIGNAAGNTFTNVRSNAINIFTNGNLTAGQGTLNATVRGNVIGSLGVAGSGSLLGSGVRIGNEGGSTLNALADNNTIREIASFEGIFVNNSVAPGILNATITNNAFAELDFDRPIQVAQVVAGGVTCSNISGNSFSGTIDGGPFGSASRIIRVRQTAGTHNSSQTSAANILAVNGGTGVITETGTITFSQPACALP